ncbi:MAG: NTP transferase domain-containing protein [Candidatus Magasanikbacteria bacterium]|nr:NTP transferase domain-containing protein [Candidatus Magasanikbacteria bacterium]
MKKSSIVKKGVILAAGLGTRFLPITKSVPKEMLPVLNKPVLQYIVEEMADSGIKNITIVISREKQAIKHYFTRDLRFEKELKKCGKYDRIEGLVDLFKKVKFSFVYQERPLGNGHALLMARGLIGKDPFVCSDADSIISGKIPAVKQLLEVHNQTSASVIGVQKITDKNMMTKYGNVYGERTADKRIYKVKEFVEKPTLDAVTPLGLIVGGMRYVFTADIWPILLKQKKGRSGEIWLAEAANTLARQKDFFAYEYEGKYLDTGNQDALLDAASFFKNKL